ncbi:MAG: ArsR/SmtB family transcription factor [Acidimicrobiales bacterium]
MRASGGAGDRRAPRTDGAAAHEHPVAAEAVARARAGVISGDDAGRLAGLLGLLADPVRSRLLFALAAVDRLCVGDLALALGATEDAVSYGLRMLRTAGLVTFRKEGRVVFYSLAPRFPHPLLEHCLRELLRIAAPEEGHP